MKRKSSEENAACFSERRREWSLQVLTERALLASQVLHIKKVKDALFFDDDAPLTFTDVHECRRIAKKNLDQYINAFMDFAWLYLTPPHTLRELKRQAKSFLKTYTGELDNPIDFAGYFQERMSVLTAEYASGVFHHEYEIDSSDDEGESSSIQTSVTVNSLLLATLKPSPSGLISSFFSTEKEAQEQDPEDSRIYPEETEVYHEDDFIDCFLRIYLSSEENGTTLKEPAVAIAGASESNVCEEDFSAQASSESIQRKRIRFFDKLDQKDDTLTKKTHPYKR